jgi:hypothetical protein
VAYRWAAYRWAAYRWAAYRLKKDFRMQVSYLKGAAGDAFNAIMVATAYNFRKFLVKTKKIFLVFFCSPKNPYILIWNFGNMAK